ncbi:hypothetical protein E8E12_001639 [Didymella heteroderae]|uniref:Uncharacterized protein n=1 Tax=Didymella heteroderae TaxID=1769908 RepID=A0A9P4WPJ3_9PLEO|nr:hypothetical protein E8E12_001639 [Didymella heteroderae]
MSASKDPIDKLTYVANGAQTVFDTESTPVSPTSSNLAAENLNVNPDFEKKLLRRIDRWLVGFYSLVYIFRVIDSANYSNAAIINLEAGTGIKKQLGFTPSQWAWTLSIFSYSYLIFEPTNTILLKLFKPSRWIFILIMALAVSGWRWLFLLEGLPAILLAFVAFWLPDYPETTSFLSKEERLYMKNRLANNAPKGEKHWDWASLKVMTKDPTLYTFNLYWICHGIGGFGVGFALPTVIYQLGFTTTAHSQLMNIPPFVSAFLLLNTLGFMLQRKWIRPWVTAIGIESTTIVCYIILLTVDEPVVRYLCLIVAVACAGCAYPVIWPERIRALEGTVASGIGIGLTNACAQFRYIKNVKPAGIVGPHVFSTVFGPRYRISYAINLSVLAVGICSILTSWLLVVRKDRRRSDLAKHG